MKIDKFLTDEAVLAELGQRLARARLTRNTSQRRLAQEAGVSGRTVARIEAGEPASLVNLIRVLRPLGLLEALDVAIPAHAIDRRRASPGSAGPTS
jgi:transcriptional regulator with XRE-family HTH domain